MYGYLLMKSGSKKSQDDLRPEYDFSELKIVARGPGRKRPPEDKEKIEQKATELTKPEGKNT
jgi:hypothetical protein